MLPRLVPKTLLSQTLTSLTEPYYVGALTGFRVESVVHICIFSTIPLWLKFGSNRSDLARDMFEAGLGLNRGHVKRPKHGQKETFPWP